MHKGTPNALTCRNHTTALRGPCCENESTTLAGIGCGGKRLTREKQGWQVAQCTAQSCGNAAA